MSDAAPVRSAPVRPAPVRSIALLANPAAGRHDAASLARLARRLAQAGLAVTTIVGERRGDLGRAVADLDVDVVAVAGGDGTLNDVVGALVARAAPRPRLAVIAQGTANVMVAEYGLPTREADVVRAIVAGRTRPLHLGATAGPDGVARPFFLATSAGVDAAIVHAVETGRFRGPKKLAFARAALLEAFRPPKPLLLDAVTVAGSRLRLAADVAIVAKASRYAGPHRLTRATAMDRPGLRLVALEHATPGRLAAAAARLALGRLETGRGVVALDVVEVWIGGRDAPAAVQIDGEPHETTPIVVRPFDVALEVVVG